MQELEIWAVIGLVGLFVFAATLGFDSGEDLKISGESIGGSFVFGLLWFLSVPVTLLIEISEIFKIAKTTKGNRK